MSHTTPTTVTPHPMWKSDAVRHLLRPKPRGELPRQQHPAALGAFHAAVPRRQLGGVYAVVIPGTPLLDAADEPWRHVHLLRRAYEGAVEARGKELGVRGRCYTFRGLKQPNGARVGESPLDASLDAFKQLAAAALVLIEHDIPPAAWAAFMVDVWIGHMGKRGAPPSKMVFSTTIITKWRGWFQSELTSFGSQRWVYPPESKAFIHRFTVMYRELGKLAHDAKDEQVRDAVRVAFPDGFSIAQAELQSTLDVYRAEVHARIASGKWVWDERSTIKEGRWRW